MSWFCITMTIMRAKSYNDLNVSYLCEVDLFVRCKDSLHFCKSAKEKMPAIFIAGILLYDLFEMFYWLYASSPLWRKFTNPSIDRS